MKRFYFTPVYLLITLALAGCVTPGGGLISPGSSSAAASGAAAGGDSSGANPNLERCSAPLGTLAVDDGRGKEWYASFGAATKVTTIEPLLRLAVQQSNCFVITSMGSNRTESKISAITDKQRNSGDFRAGSRQQKGQRVAADYFMEPSIIIDNDSTGKLAGGLAGLIGGNFARIAGSVESKVSVVTLSLFDIRSGVQIAAAEGNATATNFGAALGAFGGGAAAGLGGFSRTPDGKATVAAFVDAYNGMVISLRDYKAQEVKGGLGKGGSLRIGN
ncbi:MAG: hypothetical protein U1D25_01750 [Hydrogenophaga sp.]|uniref:hypothetical protein n=1 Tax=Hydrogenophaga sp. TaxID=1904254 RepID=UPI002779C2FF|nr:hypothetical protein [Hydrogenophaga sp.]MDP2417143.1 hypothetical protein [Hydrogenophaga sp.]MDZ4186819.1 hypothetical protein [Hydrogenophaga sp.]